MSIYINTNASFSDIVKQFVKLGYSLYNARAIALQVVQYRNNH